MPLPYSVDLRERVLLAHEHGEGNAAALAARFRVAVNTVKNWVRAAATEGRRVAKPRGRGPAPRLGAPECATLRQLVAADNDATLAEYGARLAAQTGVGVSRPVLCVTLKRLGLPRKKKTLRASEQTRADVAAERAAFAERVKSIAPEDLVFVDETGVSTKLTWLSARAPRGHRAYGSAPGHWRRLTVLGALARGGMVAVMTVAAATDWLVFQAFLQRVLIPDLRQHKPGATIVMDHLAAHRLPQARPLLESAGFALLPLPRYSPDGTVKLGESGLGRRRRGYA